MGKADFVDFLDFLDLTASHRDPPQECLVLRELLGPKCGDPNDRNVRFSRDGGGGATCGDEIEASKEAGNGAHEDDDDVDYGSDTSDIIDTSDLPSLREILR